MGSGFGPFIGHDLPELVFVSQRVIVLVTIEGVKPVGLGHNRVHPNAYDPVVSRCTGERIFDLSEQVFGEKSAVRWLVGFPVETAKGQDVGPPFGVQGKGEEEDNPAHPQREAKFQRLFGLSLGGGAVRCFGWGWGGEGADMEEESGVCN